MSVKQAIQLESSTVIGQAIKIPFEFADPFSIPAETDREAEDDRYYKFINKSYIEITPITTRTWFELKPYLIYIEEQDKDRIVAKKGVEFDSELESIVAKYDELLFSIVCIGIHNKKGCMPDWFVDVLKDNSTWQDIYILLNAILFRLNFNPFFSSITLCKNVSPLSEEEIIALQKNKETWNRKVVSCSSRSATKL